MSDSLAAEVVALPGAPRLPHAVPVPRPADQAPLPVPTSTFSTYVPFRPKCGHITMTRIYPVGFRCERCNRHGQFGWLYRCAEHRELILDDMNRHGVKTAFDSIGEHFCEKMSLGRWGPDKRQDKYSVLHEMTKEQMQSYTPGQIAILLAQRENVWKTAEQDMHSSRHNRGRAPVRWSLGANPLVSAGSLFQTIPDEISTGRPWVPRMREECTFKACHHCYRRAAEKAWLSLDGIVNGDIPPTAASAYSFHYMQQRPVCNASVVANLGCRAVPLPGRLQPTRPIIDLTQSEAATSSMRVDERDANEYDDPDNDLDWTTTDDDDSSSYSDYDVHDGEGLPRALPTLRRSVPLSTLRERLASSTPAGVAQDRDTADPEHGYVEYTQTTLDIMPYLPDDHYEPGVFLQMGGVDEVASDIPLPGPMFAEELFFTEEMMEGTEAAAKQDGEDHRFGSEAPHVPGGFAVREEAEEAGMADIVTQV